MKYFASLFVLIAFLTTSVEVNAFLGNTQENACCCGGMACHCSHNGGGCDLEVKKSKPTSSIEAVSCGVPDSKPFTVTPQKRFHFKKEILLVLNTSFSFLRFLKIPSFVSLPKNPLEKPPK